MTDKSVALRLKNESEFGNVSFSGDGITRVPGEKPQAAITCWNFQLRLMCNGKQDQFHKLVLHSETLVFSPLQPLEAVAEIESSSTFRETCLTMEVQKSFT